VKSAALLLLCLAAVPAQGEDAPYFPDAQWSSRAPAASGFGPAALDAALAFAGEHNSTGVMVVRHGYVVAERYWQGWTATTSDRIFSATKSIVSTLVGIAIDDGKLTGVDQHVSDFIPGWRDTPRAAITLRHLMSMTSGLGYAQDRLTLTPLGVDAWQRMSEAPLEHPPGTVWVYHTPAYRMLARIIEDAVGEPLADYQQRRLFAPIGMTHTSWDAVDAPSGRKNYLFMRSSVPDMARFGLLILRRGEWSGTRIVSPDFVAEATRRSQDLNPSYGYLWWLGGESAFLRPNGRGLQSGPMWPDCPRDAIGALGAMDKKIYVVPSLDLVVVRHGGAASREGGRTARADFDNAFLGAICQAVRG
jgi:CubicO group peptidase (beta-lactamase class C family)